MEFSDVLDEMAALNGRELESITAGSGITLCKIGRETRSWVLINKSGKIRRRPVKELETIWDSLKAGTPVHIDTVLAGSGSSRNQPETLYANLPFVEWSRIGGKKHLIYVGKLTHTPGTIKKADAISAPRLLPTKGRASNDEPSVLVVTPVPAEVLAQLRPFGAASETISEGCYLIRAATGTMLVVASTAAPRTLAVGTYCILSPVSPVSGQGVSIGRWQFVFAPGAVPVLLNVHPIDDPSAQPSDVVTLNSPETM